MPSGVVSEKKRGQTLTFTSVPTPLRLDSGARAAGPSSSAARSAAPVQKHAVRLQTVRGIAGELPFSSFSGIRDDRFEPSDPGWFAVAFGDLDACLLRPSNDFGILLPDHHADPDREPQGE